MPCRLWLKNESGVILVLVFIIMATLTAIVGTFLYMTSTQLKGSAYGVVSAKAFWLAEAGLQKAVWNLKTPVSSGGQGENWTTTGTSENLGDGSYTMVVGRWDFALADNGASATASSSQPGSGPARAIDGNDATRWQSDNTPSSASPESITIAFPYTLTINKVRFVATQVQNRPKDYSWQVSTDGTSFTTVATVTDNSNTDVTNTFTAASNVNHLRLRVTATGGTTNRPVRIGTLEAVGSKITSTGTVSALSRKIEQTVVADHDTQTAFDEVDWNEIVPP